MMRDVIPALMLSARSAHSFLLLRLQPFCCCSSSFCFRGSMFFRSFHLIVSSRRILQNCRTFTASQNARTSASSNTGTDCPPDTSVFWPQVPRTADELVECITRNVIWVSDDYIASAKPYEISAYGKLWKILREEERRKFGRGSEDEPPFDNWEEGEHGRRGLDYDDSETGLTIASVLPDLKRAFGGEHLFIAKAVPRDYEGPLLLARNEKAKRAVASALVSAIGRSMFFMKALYICVGKPPTAEGEGWCYSKAEFISDAEGYQYTLHPTRPSNNAMKRREIVRGDFRYRLIAYDPDADCSLVELELKKMQHRLDRLFLLDQGCPILGDILNQKCMARILGRPVYVPHKRASIRNQYIPTGLLKKLRISLKEYHQLPMFAHVHSLTLPRLIGKERKKREDVELRVPMPSYFVAVLRVFDWLRVVEEDERRTRETVGYSRPNQDSQSL